MIFNWHYTPCYDYSKHYMYKGFGKRSLLIQLKGNHLPAGNLATPTSIHLYNLHLENTLSRILLKLQSPH